MTDKPDPVPKPVLVPVTILKRQAELVLVEYSRAGSVHRCYLRPEDAAPKVPLETLNAGVPFGVPWEQLGDDAIAKKLRAAGLWTWKSITVKRRLLAQVCGDDAALMERIDQISEQAHRAELGG